MLQLHHKDSDLNPTIIKENVSLNWRNKISNVKETISMSVFYKLNGNVMLSNSPKFSI